MKSAVRGLSSLINAMSYVTGGLAALALVAAALIVTEGVIVRKVLGLSTIWQIEASVYLLMYACFVGAAFAQMHDHHLNVDLVIIHMSPRVREITLVVVSIISCVICLIIAYHAWPMWWEAFVRGDHTESLWGPPLWIPYFFIPLGMSLLFLQYLVYIGGKIRSLRRGEVEADATRFELRDIQVPKGEA